MFFFKKKPKIEFYTVCRGLEKVNPPIQARDEPNPKWVAAHAAETKKWLENNKVPIASRFSIEKCPGIRGVMDIGFHLKTWQDISLELIEDGTFKFYLPNKLSALDDDAKLFEPEVQSHSQEQFPEFCNSRQDTFPTIVKIVTPWRVKMTPGWVFLMLPVYYSDNPWFSAVPGIFNPEYGRHINVNLQIHKKTGPVFFPAGTSIVKLIPFNLHERHNFSVREAEDEEIQAEKIVLPLIRQSFIPSRKRQRENVSKAYSKCPFLNMFGK
ncbi:hypothetical protein EBU95_07585 [bacterium]|nr:hypothetical protein [bacterium]